MIAEDALFYGGDPDKWWRLTVVGENVSPLRAEAICVCTDTLMWSCSASGQVEQLNKLFGLKPVRPGASMDAIRQWLKNEAEVRERLGILDLAYMSNDRIMSNSWLGPHGWCDWDGTIGCGNYNIGKHPDTDSVREELELIADRWRFLDMRVQVRTDDDTDTVRGEWTVKDGRVAEVEPGPVLVYTPESSRKPSRSRQGVPLDQVARTLQVLRVVTL